MRAYILAPPSTRVNTDLERQHFALRFRANYARH